MLNYKVGRGSAGKSVFKGSSPLLAPAPVNSVHDGDLLVFYKIGIVSYSVRHRILALEQVEIRIICAQVPDCVCDYHIYPPVILCFLKPVFIITFSGK